MTKKDFIKFLSAFELSRSKISKILAAMDGIYDFERFYLSDAAEKILGKDYSSIAKKSNPEYLKKYEDRLKEKGIGLLTCEDEEYPEKLCRIDDPPFYLFYMGDLSLLSEKCVAIVGTRTPTGYGDLVTERFAGELAEAGAVIISGLAYGVDSTAHRKALEVKGKTIAILANGFDKIYPSQHTSLVREIAKNGLVLSEHRPDIKPSKFAFPQRNRIVAGLSDAVLVTEAGAKSGTTITKDFALDYGIAVYAVPGNINSPKSEGTNELICSMQGICVVDAGTILSDLGLERKKNRSKQLSIEEGQITSLLSDGDKEIDFLSEKLNISINKLNSLLTMLEIKGIIKRMPGGSYSLA